MLVRTCGDLLLVAHGKRTPTDTEWEDFLSHYRNAPSEKPRTLVFTFAGSPDLQQRRKLHEALGTSPPLIALLTEAPLVRVAGEALSRFIRHFRVFHPSQAPMALEHLRVAPQEHPAVLAALAALQEELLLEL